MRSRVLLFVLVSLLFVFPVVSCCGDDGATPPPVIIPPDQYSCSIPDQVLPSQPYYTVYADKDLPEDNKLAVADSLREWCVKTNGTLRYNLVYTDMTKQPASTSDPHTIRVYIKDPGPGYVGWTSWQSGSFSAYTLVAPGLDINTFRKVMLHELGHAFNLDFNGSTHYAGPAQSVMYPSIGNSSEHLGCPELKAFCSAYGCSVECTDTVKSAETFAGETKDDRLW